MRCGVERIAKRPFLPPWPSSTPTPTTRSLSMLLGRSMLRPLPLLARASCLARPMATSPKTALIKELRARTSAPMKKCVDALAAADGDLDAAVDWLRKSGVATAHKKADRGANEGAVVVASDQAGCVLVELNSETDFVARNGLFHELASGLAKESLSLVRGGGTGAGSGAGSGSGPYEIEPAVLAALPLPQAGGAGGSLPAAEAISVAVSQLGENLVLRRACALPVPAEGGVVTSYVHNTYAPGLGRTAAAVALRSQADPTALQALGTSPNPNPNPCPTLVTLTLTPRHSRRSARTWRCTSWRPRRGTSAATRWTRRCSIASASC